MWHWISTTVLLYTQGRKQKRTFLWDYFYFCNHSHITLVKSKYGWSACCLSSAVQSERKPIDVVPREKHTNCAASTQKIYIRKDLNSPLIATPTFMSDTETDGSRSVGIRPTDKPQASFSISRLLVLCELAFDDALCHVQIQPAGPGDAG